MIQPHDFHKFAKLRQGRIPAIKAGINIIHINTEIRLAWRRGVEEGLQKNPNEIAPYKILPPAFEAIRRIVKERLKLFGGEI